MKFEVGDLVQRTKPFLDEVGNIWLVIKIEEENEIRPICFVSLMNCRNQHISKFIRQTAENSFEKVK